MAFAINWSPEAAELLNEGAIEIELYKCPNWQNLVEKAQAQRPAYIHFPLVIGRNQHKDWDFAAIENWLKTTDTHFVNSHIIPSKPHFPEAIGLDDLSDALIKEVEILVKQFGAERVIIENCPYTEFGIKDGYLSQGMQPQLIQNITTATGCGLLLDVSHVVLTCEIFKQDWQEYIQLLPVNRIREMHITGIGTWSTGEHGDHVPLTESDWLNVEWCFEQIRAGKWSKPEIVALEYGGIGWLKDVCGSDKNAIAEQVPRLYKLVQEL
jgi:uncharacterized protein (UPF0276 family)